MIEFDLSLLRHMVPGTSIWNPIMCIPLSQFYSPKEARLLGNCKNYHP